MNEALALYIFTRLDSVKNLIGLLLIVSAPVLLALFLVWLHVDVPEGVVSKRVFRSIRRVGFSASVLAFLYTALPNKEDAMFIAAGTGVIEVARSEFSQRLTGKTLLGVEKALDEYLAREKEK